MVVSILAPWLEILYTAAASKYGVVVAVSAGPEAAKQYFYRARAQSKDPSLAKLQIRTSPDTEGELWIVKGKANGS